MIDSGDWGRQRVQELCAAGRVLQAERDALQKLVESAAAGGSSSASVGASACSAGIVAICGEVPLGDANNSPEAAAPASGALQQYCVSAAGIQPAGGTAGGLIPAGWGSGSGSGPLASSRPTSPAARNKLLVRMGRGVVACCAQPHACMGLLPCLLSATHSDHCCRVDPHTARAPSLTRRTAPSLAPSLACAACAQVRSGSAFNAMVRALKQDLVAAGGGGAAARGGASPPLYEVDKVGRMFALF